MMSTEVTQQQWRWVMQQNPSYYKQCGDDCPVESVSWLEVQEFISRLNELTKRTDQKEQFRLPTEEEWEYAAYGGNLPGTSQGVQASTNDIGWNERNSGRYTHPVAKKKPNAIGLYDMIGNVSEWTSSPHYSQKPMYYCRGGAVVFFNNRTALEQDKRGAVIGFRLCYSKEK